MTINKSKKLQNVHYGIRGPLLDKAEELAKQGHSIIKLNTGNPAAFGFQPEDYIYESMCMDRTMAAAYSQSKGIDSAREAIVKYCAGKGFRVHHDDVFTGNGVSELIMTTAQALLDTGDEVLVPSPDYPLWTAAIRLSGGKAVHYMCDEQAGWYPDILDIQRKITGRTKAIVIINPNNPTGALYPEELLRVIIDIARQHNLLILSDEIYDRLVFDEKQHISVAALAGDVPVITYNGLSKSHHICGFRCGWMSFSGNRNEARSLLEGLNTLASMRLCSNVPAQMVIARALEDVHYTDRQTQPGGRLYEQREYVWRALNRMPGISAVKPQAGLYIFPRLDLDYLGIDSDEQFVHDFLMEKHVLLTHGQSFNWPVPDHLRVVYLPDMDTLEQVMDDMHIFAEQLGKKRRKAASV